MKEREYSTAELMAVVLSRHLQDGWLTIVGTASQIPLAACRLAQLTHAPNLSVILPSGFLNPKFRELVDSTGDYRLIFGSEAIIPFSDVIDLEMRSRLDVFFAGGIQCDMYGNLNLVYAGGDWKNPKFRGPGSIGLPFLSRVKRFFIFILRHEPRVFVEKVDFISGPGHLTGPIAKREARLTGGPEIVVTDIAVLDFDPKTLRMRLRSVHEGHTIEEVQMKTGFKLIIPEEVGVTEPPTEFELKLLRSEIDPKGVLRRLL